MNGDTLYPRFRNPLLGAPKRPLPKHVAIVGAGTIGPDVGYYLKSSLPDSTLTLIDVREEALASIRDRFASYAAEGCRPQEDDRGDGGAGAREHRHHDRLRRPQDAPTW